MLTHPVTQPEPVTTAPPAAECRTGWRGGARALFLVAVVLWVYAPSLTHPLVFDDDGEVRHSPRLAEPLEWWRVVSGPRPLVDVSLALQVVTTGWWLPAIRGLNLALHAVAALVLMDLAARLLARAPLGRAEPAACGWLGWTIALAWAVHPLASEAVLLTHQRSETLSTLAMFGLMNCWVRSLDAPRRRAWLAASVACGALGALAKETLAMAPLVVLAWDRALVPGSWGEWARRSGGYYAALAALWIIPLIQVVPRIDQYQRAGLATTSRVSVAEYARSQPGVLLHYLRLAAWPVPQCLDYDWPVAAVEARTLAAAGGVAVLGAGVAWGLARRSAWGALGATGLLWLAPTSSLVPIHDLCVEHRMYLPLAVVVAAAVTGGWLALRGGLRHTAAATPRGLAVGGAVAAMIVGGAWLTRQRVQLFADPVALWTQTLSVAPENPRALDNLALSLMRAGRPAEAEPRFRAALGAYADRGRFQPKTATNYGLCLDRLDRDAEAIAFYQGVLAEHPEAAEHPQVADIRNNLGALLLERGDPTAAEHVFREAVRDQPDRVEPRYNWALALARQGELAEARRQFEAALALARGRDAEPVRRRIRRALASLEAAQPAHVPALAVPAQPTAAPTR